MNKVKKNTQTLSVGFCVFILLFVGYTCTSPNNSNEVGYPEPQYFLSSEQTHNKFSRNIPPVLRVPSGAVVQVETKEATDGQLSINSKSEDVPNVKFDPIHPLTGPVYVEGAEPGDILSVTLHHLEVGDWAWSGVFPDFGFLAD